VEIECSKYTQLNVYIIKKTILMLMPDTVKGPIQALFYSK